MLILTYRVWWGLTDLGKSELKRKGLDEPESKIKHQGFATRMPLGKAIQCVKDYETEWKNAYPHTATEYELLQVSIVENLSDEEVVMARMQLIEHLHSPD